MLGDFEVEGVLGEGGSGIVYDARWGPRRVALKVLRSALVPTARARAQFLAEAGRLQTITHPSVVKVLAVGTLPDERPYLAMERLEGEPLARALGRGAMAIEQALPLFVDLCGAVGALHAQGLVHRDLKPENVFVVDGKHAVLLDFGIAKELTEVPSTTTQDGNVRGTPAYMAPERFFGQPASIATDIYELAVTLYAMLAGGLPWQDSGDPELRLSPRPLEGVPSELDAAVRRALSTRAENRPASAALLLDAVRAAVAGGAEPAAADTARLHPAAPTQQGAPDHHAEAAPGPGDPASATASTRRRWPRVAAVVGIAAAATLAAVSWRMVRAAGHPAPSVTLAEDDRSGSGATAVDPWAPDLARAGGSGSAEAGSTVEAAAMAIPLVAPAESHAAAVARMADFARRLPADSRIVATIQLGELRQVPVFEKLLHKLVEDPRMALVTSGVPACVREALAGATWIAVGASSLESAAGAVALVGGRWQRADIERCLTAAETVKADHGGYKLLFGGLEFLDEHTFVMTTRTDASRPAAALTRAGTKPSAQLAAVLPRVDEDAVFAIAIDGAGEPWPGDGLPRGSDVWGNLRTERDEVVFEVTFDPHTAKAAADLERAAHAQVDSIFTSELARRLGRVDIQRDKTAVTLHGRATSALLGGLTASL